MTQRIKYEALQNVKLLAHKRVFLKSNTQYCSNQNMAHIPINISMRGRNAKYVDFGDAAGEELSGLKKGGMFYMIRMSASSTTVASAEAMRLVGRMNSRLIYFH